MRIGKLVRDKIPEIAAAKGQYMRTRVAHPMERLAFLEGKLYEETLEVLETDTYEEALEEVADVLTVLQALVDHYGFYWSQVVDQANKKTEERGSFKKFLIWERSE